MKIDCRNGWYPVIALLLSMIAAQVHAHIQNENTLYPDIQSSPARYDIVMLAAAGVIPQTPKFEPDAKLTRSALAAWAALANGLGQSGERPDVDALAKAARQAGLINSLEGEASYADINDALFAGKLTAEHSEHAPTRAEAAQYIAANVSQQFDGKTLLMVVGVRNGPSGNVEKIESRENADGSSSIFVTIGGETHPFYAHGKVANGSDDVADWQGRSVTRSLLRDLSGLLVWVYLEGAGEGTYDSSAQSHDAAEHMGHAEHEKASDKMEHSEPK